MTMFYSDTLRLQWELASSKSPNKNRTLQIKKNTIYTQSEIKLTSPV